MSELNLLPTSAEKSSCCYLLAFSCSLVSGKTLSEPIGYLGAVLYQLNILCSGGRNGRQLPSLWLGPQLCYFHSQTASISKKNEKQR